MWRGGVFSWWSVLLLIEHVVCVRQGFDVLRSMCTEDVDKCVCDDLRVDVPFLHSSQSQKDTLWTHELPLTKQTSIPKHRVRFRTLRDFYGIRLAFTQSFLLGKAAYQHDTVQRQAVCPSCSAGHYRAGAQGYYSIYFININSHRLERRLLTCEAHQSTFIFNRYSFLCFFCLFTQDTSSAVRQESIHVASAAGTPHATRSTLNCRIFLCRHEGSTSTWGKSDWLLN